MLVNPAADIPIVQVSVLANEDPASHFRMGRALQALRTSNVAIVGSGFATFHNLPAMMRLFTGSESAMELRPKVEAWSDTLAEAVLEETAAERERKLAEWREFPHSYYMHPRGGAEHFLPLLVCAGAAGDGKGGSYKDRFNGVDVWSFYWE